ncbi:carboxypeptidase-like regulatory domain-containing protein [Hymenobacter sp. M29]|uniref:Carboxypeptidase-like regulatory domain-containing protein n=1 Tax=Hymenobacter mellowenesis TaxID=3063995 RepID=A0ABT9A8A3_9BACT|nr:carboxypeptidase-like regulatory domain-containing protein [Hymenobacter sp. M29]MDO7845599.1 carboxypeptidase-like regulatory domain-containing protein [Hymenobacter sp. M29]
MLLSFLFSLPSTAPAVRGTLGIHIAAGTLALLVGLIPMLGRKGGPVHVRAGRIYTYSMVVVAATAVLLCLLQPLTLGRLFLTGVAILSFYLSFSGWRAARRHSSTLLPADVALAVAATLVGLGMVVAGIWLQAVLFAFFGGLICVFAGLDAWHGLRPAVAAPMPWLFRHFIRMGGSYISATTAFVVVNLGRWLPAGAPSWAGLVGWIAPSIIGGLLIRATVRRYKAKARTARGGAAAAAVAALFLLSLPAAAQSAASRQLSGQFTDEAGQALPYATVGVVGKGVGTVADAQGRFQLALPATVAAADTVRFALLGYASRASAVAALPAGPLAVALRPAAVALAAVTVQARGLDTVRIGNPHYRTRLQTNFALGTQPGLNVGSEIGRVFQLPRRGAWLRQFEFILSANDFDTVQFRINIYQLRHGVPGPALLRQPIYRQVVGKGARRVRIDLQAEPLFAEDAVAVAVEWVSHSRQGQRLALPLLMPAFATHLYRYGAANSWKRFASMSTAMELEVLAVR